MSKASVASLGTPDKDGWLTKCDTSMKSWKKRWFVLKGDTMYYFKTPKDTEQKGDFKFEKTSTIQQEPSMNKKGKYHFSVGTPGRKYVMYADSEDAAKAWVEKIIQLQKGDMKSSTPSESSTPVNTGSNSSGGGSANSSNTPPSNTTNNSGSNNSGGGGGGNSSGGGSSGSGGNKDISPRVKMALAKGTIPFLQDEDSKVLEFWQIWSESLPPKDDLQAGTGIEYHVSTSANMQKLTWRTAGPQNIFIQKMVDFFWNVGAPESEIDRLNDVGALINPTKIGSWIDMSAKGGMDGGWYFPVEIPLKMAIEAADPGDPSKKVAEWGEKHSVEKSFSVGRDMGAAPPRQTEIRLCLPGNDFQSQLRIGLDAFDQFGFPPMPENAIAILNDSNIPGLRLSVITSSEGFVRLGLLVPKPSRDALQKLCSISGANADDLKEFERSLGVDGPAFAEYQFLKEGFGYGVYKEGFDIVFHYEVGLETSDD